MAKGFCLSIQDNVCSHVTVLNCALLKAKMDPGEKLQQRCWFLLVKSNVVLLLSTFWNISLWVHNVARVQFVTLWQTYSIHPLWLVTVGLCAVTNLWLHIWLIVRTKKTCLPLACYLDWLDGGKSTAANRASTLIAISFVSNRLLTFLGAALPLLNKNHVLLWDVSIFSDCGCQYLVFLVVKPSSASQTLVNLIYYNTRFWQIIVWRRLTLSV